jgi:uncharacterized membrane protein
VSDRLLRRTALVLALAGLAVAGYLTYVHYAELEPLCGLGGDCERVQTSVYAEVAGVPVALLGLLGYALILASLVVPGDAGLVGGAALSLIGFGFSAYLTYRELFTIEAICSWCVASAVLLTLLAVVTCLRVVRAGARLPP